MTQKWTPPPPAYQPPHLVTNSDEKWLLLALAAGHVDTRKTPCPVPGWRPVTRQALEAARGALDLGPERGYGEGKTSESSSGVAVTAVHPAGNPLRVPASPFVSRLASSSEEERDSEGPEAGRPCADRGCRRDTERIQAQLTDLGKQGHCGARDLPFPQPTSLNLSVDRPARSDADGRAHQAALSEERGPVPGLPIGNPAGRLSSTALVLIRREVRALIRGICRRVVVHEVRTKQVKENRLIPKASLVRCHRTAGRKIPALLDSLESNPSTRQQWRFYGFLTGYLTSISGHRCGVFQNLTIQEVEEASRSPDESAYVINITTHKTNRAFGAAQLSLNREEYSWFRRFLALQAGLPGGSQATYFFFTSRASPCRTLNKYFQSAWISMGLPGKPTFTEVWTAIATHAKNAHSSEDRRKVAQFMCHDTSTSDKFYALHLGLLQARERRRLFERALVEEEDGEAAGTESPPRKGHKRTETPVSPLVKSDSLWRGQQNVWHWLTALYVSLFQEGTSRRTLPWRPAMASCQGKKPGRSSTQTNRRL
ncbi:uncharacterized protein [Danio rerio]|uniref:Uncharacterized protein n=1 Tax=Danio rerio TaxID=7955 RepID=A0AC58JFE2_DANRE